MKFSLSIFIVNINLVLVFPEGGAISQAKGAFSNWWSTLTTVQSTDAEARSEEATPECEEAIQNLANESSAGLESPNNVIPTSQTEAPFITE